jgi:hypothetical protein
MNEELFTAIRELAIRSEKKAWWQPWQFSEQVGNDDAEFIAAISPEIVLDLLHEIERRFAIQAELNALRTRTNQLISETNKYAAEISLGKSATIKMGIQLDDAKESINALTLALEVERDAANLYAKQVAHWIGKHDALLEQQLATSVPQEWNDKNVLAWCVARGIQSAQPVREPLSMEQIEKLDCVKMDFDADSQGTTWYLDADSIKKFARAIERAHGIGGDK